MNNLKISINGSSRGLGNFLLNNISTCLQDVQVSPVTARLNDFENTSKQLNSADVFINNAHSNFEQTILTYKVYEMWRMNPDKYIISIGSRAGEDNMSKGYLYSSSKSSLKQLHMNLTYNSEKKVRLTYLSLGLVESKLPSLRYTQILNTLVFLLQQPNDIEIPILSLQNSTSYQFVQQKKSEAISSGTDYFNV